MTVASAPAERASSRKGKRIAAQSLGLLLNFALVGLSILWFTFAVDTLGGTLIGRGMYRFLPEIHVAVVVAILAVTIAGLVFAILSMTALAQARIYWWRAAAVTVVIGAIATSYFSNSSGNIVGGNTDFENLPEVPSGIATVVALAWLALTGLAIKYSQPHGPAGGASLAAQKTLTATWLRRFYLTCGAIFVVCGAAEVFFSFVTAGRLVDGGREFPNYSARMLELSLISLASGVAMLFLGRAARKNPELFGKAWWLPPAAVLVVCACVLYAMDPAEYNVGTLAGPGELYLTVYIARSGLAAAFCLVWLVSGVWLQWRASQRRESVWAFAASAAAVLAMFSTVEAQRYVAGGSRPVATTGAQPAAKNNAEQSPAKSAEPVPAESAAKAEPKNIFKQEWSTLEGSDDEAKLDAFASRAQGTPYAALAHNRLADIRARKAEAAARPAAPAQAPDAHAALRDEWATLADSSDRRRLISFISRAQGTPYAEMARARLEKTAREAPAQPPRESPSKHETPSADMAEAWSTVQNTTSEAVLETFISRSSGTIYNALARARLEELRTQARETKMAKEAAERAAAQRAAEERAAAEREAEQRAAAERAAELDEHHSMTPITGPPTCDSLWYQRNQVFHLFNYCFQKGKSLTVFGNTGCFRNQNEAWEAMGESNRQLIKSIRELEARMKC